MQTLHSPAISFMSPANGKSCRQMKQMSFILTCTGRARDLRLSHHHKFRPPLPRRPEYSLVEFTCFPRVCAGAYLKPGFFIFAILYDCCTGSRVCFFSSSSSSSSSADLISEHHSMSFKAFLRQDSEYLYFQIVFLMCGTSRVL
jgi:hypothetical protein